VADRYRRHRAGRRWPMLLFFATLALTAYFALSIARCAAAL
jgi:hypothetical protein